MTPSTIAVLFDMYAYWVVSDVVTAVIMLVYILEPTSRHILVLFLFQNGPGCVIRTRNRDGTIGMYLYC
jgi:hypothetical protein